MIQKEIQSYTQPDFQQWADNLEQKNELIEQDYQYELENYEMDVDDFDLQNEENNQETDVVSNQALFKLLEKQKFLIQEKCQISPDNVIELLRHYKWNQNKLEEEYFQNPNLILLELQKSGDYNNHDSVLYPQDNGKPEPCQNCKYESPLIQLGCKHKICKNCLQQLINQKIYNGEKKIPCLIENCVYKLPTSMISTIISKKVVDDLLVQEFVSSSHEFIICKNKQCQKILKRPNNPFLIVNCECGQSFCFRCKLENHAPVSCEMANYWLLEIEEFKILNSAVHGELNKKGLENFLYYKQEYIKFENRYQQFKHNEIVYLKNMKAINESEVETVFKAFEELLSISSFLKWMICFEQQTYEMNMHIKQIICNKTVLNKMKELLSNLLNSILEKILFDDDLIHYQLLKNLIRELGANRVISENKRKMLEQEYLEFQLLRIVKIN